MLDVNEVLPNLNTRLFFTKAMTFYALCLLLLQNEEIDSFHPDISLIWKWQYELFIAQTISYVCEKYSRIDLISKELLLVRG